MKKQVITTIAIAVVVGAAGFFGGLAYGQSPSQLSKLPMAKLQQVAQAFRNGSGAGGGFRLRGGTGGGGQNGGGFTAGTVLSKDDKSITVKLSDGSSKLVFYSTSTPVEKPTAVDASQLNTGDNVVVSGTANSDGSLTAQNIQIRPAGQNGGRPPAPGN